MSNETAGCIAVIGAGFSGTMAAIQLRRSLPAAQAVTLIERSGAFARGLAYGETAQPHLLNVRAANMSAFADDPGHFERWLERQDCAGELRATPAGRFATRRLYGRYLQDTLRREIAASGGIVRLLTADISAMERTAQGWALLGDDGSVWAVRGVVLATGSLPASRPCDEIEFYDPWTPRAATGLAAEAPVLVVGTGLTMVDLVLALHAQGFAGPIIALSRRGLVPQPHAAIATPWPAPVFAPESRSSALALLRAVREELRAAAAQNIGWRAVIDSLRPQTASLWRALPPSERARFLRHVRPYWDIHRHRIAPPAAEVFQALRASGQLRILRGRIRDVRRGRGLATVLIRQKGRFSELAVQRIIYATGLHGERARSGLVASLLASGQARLDGHNLGLEVTETLALVDAAGQVQPGIWALGPLVRGMFWECLAVPDIRVQAGQLAGEIAAALAGAAGVAALPP